MKKENKYKNKILLLFCLS